jgi:hypothetical protein
MSMIMSLAAAQKQIAELVAQNKQLGDMYHQRGNDIAWLKRQARKARAEALREAAAVADERYAAGDTGNPGFHIRALIEGGAE